MTAHIAVLGGPVAVTRDGTRRSARHGTDRVYALVELLAWARGDGIATGRLTELLWRRPAAALLRKTVQRARTLLGDADSIMNLRGAYMLNERMVTCDLWELEDQAIALLAGSPPQEIVSWARRVAYIRPPEGMSDQRLMERVKLLASLDPPREAAALFAARALG